MWVSIIPVGTGNNLGRLENISKQSKIATSHKGLIDLKLEDVKTGQSIEEINNGIDPFTEL
jgi:diacylglycerol kinase family enzyme